MIPLGGSSVSVGYLKSRVRDQVDVNIETGAFKNIKATQRSSGTVLLAVQLGNRRKHSSSSSSSFTASCRTRGAGLTLPASPTTSNKEELLVNRIPGPPPSLSLLSDIFQFPCLEDTGAAGICTCVTNCSLLYCHFPLEYYISIV